MSYLVSPIYYHMLELSRYPGLDSSMQTIAQQAISENTGPIKMQRWATWYLNIGLYAISARERRNENGV